MAVQTLGDETKWHTSLSVLISKNNHRLLQQAMSWVSALWCFIAAVFMLNA